jgi:hypothetical protein
VSSSVIPSPFGPARIRLAWVGPLLLDSTIHLVDFDRHRLRISLCYSRGLSDRGFFRTSTCDNLTTLCLSNPLIGSLYDIDSLQVPTTSKSLGTRSILSLRMTV